MPEKFTIHVCRKSGLPYVEIPHEAIWNLVEYLALQRVRVQYSYQSTHFRTFFLSLDVPNAQQLMDDWAASLNAPQESTLLSEAHSVASAS